MKLTIRDINYYIQIHSKQPDLPYLVMLHGFMGSGRAFNRLVPHLQEGLNIITIDLLGHGKTQGTENKHRFTGGEQLTDLGQIIHKLELKDFYLYGYSMGGRLALRLALQYGDNLQALILESTHEGIRSSEERARRAQTDQAWADRIRGDFEGFLEWWSQLDLFQASGNDSADDDKLYREIQRQQVPEQMALSLEGFGQGSVQPVHDQLFDLNIPVLLAAGALDSKYVKRMQTMNELMTDARLEIIPGAAHRIHLDAPEKWSEKIRSFVHSLTD